jgi:uncharacterized protein (DUF305 family)
MYPTTRLRRACVLASLALAGALVLTACGGDDDDTNAEKSAARPSVGASTTPTTSGGSTGSASPTGSAGSAATHNDADVTFARLMIPHHEQAVEMARQAPAKAADPAVKQLAAAIEAAQAPEIAQLKGWLSGWGEPLSAPMEHGGHDMGGMMSAADMERFGKSTGAEFDRMFLEMMIVHHEGAITMAKDELAKGTAPEARGLAEAIQKSQTDEVARMKAMLGTPTTGATTGATAPAHH